MQTKHLLLSLFLLAGCKAGDSASTTQNILNCQNYGSNSESTTTIEEAPELPYEDTTTVLQSDFQQEQPESPAPEDTSLKPVAPGLGIGIIKSRIDEIDAASCEAVGLCVIVGVERGKVVVEHCNDISFPGAEQ